MADTSSQSLQDGLETQASPSAAAEPEASPKPARRRGRPRKSESADAAQAVEASADATNTTTTRRKKAQDKTETTEPALAPAPRKRGRPRKNPLSEAEQAALIEEQARLIAQVMQEVKTDEIQAQGKAEDGASKTESQLEGENEATSAKAAPKTRTTKRISKKSETVDHKAEGVRSEDRAEKPARADRKQDRKADREQRADKNSRKNNRRQRRQSHFEPSAPKVSREDLLALKVSELKEKATELDIDLKEHRLKADLVEAIYKTLAQREGFCDCEGILDVLADGYGFLRTNGYLPSEGDIYVNASMIRRMGLRKGDKITGSARPGSGNDKYPALQKIKQINDMDPDQMQSRPHFTKLTPIYPNEPLVMEYDRSALTGRCIDLVAPVGKGQRGLIVSPPKAGKTTILKNIAQSVAANNPEVHLICLLVDERPEEVTDMERSIKGEVVASTFDMPWDQHIAVSELVVERAKRLVELGEDVVILLDSITRLARAYNLAQPAGGRILSGGVDSTALYPPKKFLGAARNIENGGSLTILASALVDTGSKMDEVIFEEFKGTGNMELKLDRELADRRIFPAIDPITSGTRKEDLLLNPSQAPFIWGIRRLLANMNNTERAMTMLIKSLKQTADNQEFLMRSARKAQAQGQGTGAGTSASSPSKNVGLEL